MSTCLVSDFLPELHSAWGGAEVACARIMRLLQDHGQDVFAVTTQPAKAPPTDLPLHVLPTCGRYLGQHIDFELKDLVPLEALAHREAWRLLRRLRPRVVHLQRASQLSLSVVRAAWELGITVVFSLYDLWTLCPLCSLLGRRAIVKRPIRIESSVIFDGTVVDADTGIRNCVLTPTQVVQCAQVRIPA